MNDDCFFIVLPNLGANDVEATVVDWSVDEGEFVEVGELVCSVETTKATFDIESEHSGYLAQLIKIGDEVAASNPLALIAKSSEKVIEEKEKYFSKNEISSDAMKIKKVTKKALKRAEELNIDITDINVSGVIKESDIEKYDKGKKNKSENLKSFNSNVSGGDEQLEEVIELIGNQKAGKSLMLESVSTIPQSYIEIELEVTELEKNIEWYSKRQGVIVTLLSVIVCATGKALKEYKLFNSYRDLNQIKIKKEINIGIVVSYKNSISIPVIKNASEVTPDTVVKELMRMRMDLMKKKTKMEDLSSSTFTISPMDHSKLTRFVPIVHPQQSAVLSIPSVQTKFVLKTDNQIYEKRSISLGLSFDHTFLDASQANDFFEEIVCQVVKISSLLKNK
jgi:pyruvate/2-oxoglutarate dehydrogenase complex dihydrolipoamide acyltransferase (E2) component